MDFYRCWQVEKRVHFMVPLLLCESYVSMVRDALSKSDLNSIYVLVEKVRTALITNTSNNFWKLSHDYYNRLELRYDKKGPSFSASCSLYHIQPT